MSEQDSTLDEHRSPSGKSPRVKFNILRSPSQDSNLSVSEVGSQADWEEEYNKLEEEHRLTVIAKDAEIRQLTVKIQSLSEGFVALKETHDETEKKMLEVMGDALAKGRELKRMASSDAASLQEQIANLTEENLLLKKEKEQLVENYIELTNELDNGSSQSQIVQMELSDLRESHAALTRKCTNLTLVIKKNMQLRSMETLKSSRPTGELYETNLYSLSGAGHIATTDNNHIFYKTFGTPDKPAIVSLHSGPGAGMESDSYRWFDPEKYFVVLFDQRGCGQSLPTATDDESLKANTMHNLLADLELIRKHLNIKKWHVFGRGWGGTLGLAYSVSFPLVVCSLTVQGVFMGSTSEIDYAFRETGGLSQFLPVEFDRFVKYIKGHKLLTRAEADQDILSCYYKLLTSKDENVQKAAAYEFVLLQLAAQNMLDRQQHPDFPEKQFACTMCDERFAKKNDLKSHIAIHYTVYMPWMLVTIHYIMNNYFLKRNQLLTQANRIKVPVTILQGCSDLNCSPRVAWDLYNSLDGNNRSDVNLTLVPGAGHSPADPQMMFYLRDVFDKRV